MARMNRSFHRENKACVAALDAPAGVDAGEAYRPEELCRMSQGPVDRQAALARNGWLASSALPAAQTFWM